MTLQQIKYILAVVDLNNFETAAEHCNVTQSTLSSMIAKLEKEIDFKIFNRKTKPVTLTDQGLQIIENLRAVTHQYEALKDTIMEVKNEVSGELSIGIIPTVAPYLIPLFLTSFVKENPTVKLKITELTTSEIQKSILNRSIDIGILAIPLYTNQTEEYPLYEESLMVLDYSNSLPEGDVSMGDIDLEKLRLLQEGHCLRGQIESICELTLKQNGNLPNYSVEAGSMTSLINLTKATDGMTIIPYLASLDLVNENKGILHDFQSPIPIRQIGLITHRDFFKKKLLQKLSESIIQSTDHILPEWGEISIVRP